MLCPEFHEFDTATKTPEMPREIVGARSSDNIINQTTPQCIASHSMLIEELIRGTELVRKTLSWKQLEKRCLYWEDFRLRLQNHTCGIPCESVCRFWYSILKHGDLLVGTTEHGNILSYFAQSLPDQCIDNELYAMESARLPHDELITLADVAVGEKLMSLRLIPPCEIRLEFSRIQAWAKASFTVDHSFQDIKLVSTVLSHEFSAQLPPSMVESFTASALCVSPLIGRLCALITTAHYYGLSITQISDFSALSGLEFACALLKPNHRLDLLLCYASETVDPSIIVSIILDHVFQQDVVGPSSLSELLDKVVTIFSRNIDLLSQSLNILIDIGRDCNSCYSSSTALSVAYRIASHMHLPSTLIAISQLIRTRSRDYVHCLQAIFRIVTEVDDLDCLNSIAIPLVQLQKWEVIDFLFMFNSVSMIPVGKLFHRVIKEWSPNQCSFPAFLEYCNRYSDYISLGLYFQKKAESLLYKRHELSKAEHACAQALRYFLQENNMSMADQCYDLSHRIRQQRNPLNSLS